ncbi:hypothetical protein PUR23_17645 [Methylorubrum populi]
MFSMRTFPNAISAPLQPEARGGDPSNFDWVDPEGYPSAMKRLAG